VAFGTDENVIRFDVSVYDTGLGVMVRVEGEGEGEGGG
jgi:hypothetical protein